MVWRGNQRWRGNGKLAVGEEIKGEGGNSRFNGEPTQRCDKGYYSTGQRLTAARIPTSHARKKYHHRDPV